MGACAYIKLLKYLPYLSNGALIEIGGDRGESSTKFFAGLVCGTNRKFYSIDPSEYVAQGINQYKSYLDNFWYYQTTGENFLKNFNEPIAYAYLDNYDYNNWEHQPKDTWEDWVVEMIDEYDNHSNKKCHQVHLEQTKKIVELAANRCIIQFDDTYGNLEDFLLGKGATAIPWLIDNGWKVIDVIEDGGGWTLANFNLGETHGK
jgi:hypothetical protein